MSAAGLHADSNDSHDGVRPLPERGLQHRQAEEGRGEETESSEARWCEEQYFLQTERVRKLDMARHNRRGNGWARNAMNERLNGRGLERGRPSPRNAQFEKLDSNTGDRFPERPVSGAKWNLVVRMRE